MTNLKKLGLTALAGSLVATTGYAGSLDISGAAKVSYASGDTSETSGNPWSINGPDRTFELVCPVANG